MKKIKTDVSEKSKTQSTKLTKSSTSIDCLPDDCLFLIFSKLNIYEAIKVERVCKRWRNVSLKLWSKMRTLIVTHKNNEAARKLPSCNLGEVLRRSGKTVTEIKFTGGAGKFEPDKAFPLINRYCKQLQVLEFSYCFGGKEVQLNKISSSVARNLKGLYICNNCKIDKTSLVAFLKKAVNLENLWLKSCKNVTNDALLNLSSKCKDLNLQLCKLNKRTYSKKLFEKLSKLQDLDVSRTNILPEALCSISKNLVTLSLRGCAKFFKGDSFKHIFMPNLETLDLGWNMSVTDDVVSYFNTCFPALKNLCLEGCEKMNFDDSCRLQDCKNIRELDVSETYITEFNFIHLVAQMANLESLIVDCDELTESGLIMAVASLPKLEYIFVGETLKLTEKFFKDVLKLVTLRNYDREFEIEIDCLEKNAKKLKQIMKDEIARLGLKKEEDLSTKSKCVVTFGDKSWYVEGDED